MSSGHPHTGIAEIRAVNRSAAVGETVYTTQGMHPGQGYFFFQRVEIWTFGKQSERHVECSVNFEADDVLAAILTLHRSYNDLNQSINTE